MAGILYVVATPIGNLEDVSPRAARVLGACAWIACEDTRRTAGLLARHGIRARTVSCHKFNERARLAPVLARLRSGDSVALVSDGGTPCVSDPGSLLVDAAAREGIPVVPVPGPSSVLAILAISGLPADRFVFDGFLPPRAGPRRKRLLELRGESRTVVVFESPHRVRGSLTDMAEVLGDRQLVLGRELTKLHETVLRGTPRSVLEALGEGEVRGEIVVAVAGADSGARDEDAHADGVRAWRQALAEAQGDRREALRRAARALGVGRAELHRRLQEWGEDAGGTRR